MTIDYAPYVTDWNAMVADTELKKTASNAFFKGHKYAPLEDILPTIQTSLARHNFLLLEELNIVHTQDPVINSAVTETSGDKSTTESNILYHKATHNLTLIHVPSGITRTSVYFLGTLDQSPQQQGSAITYARRYHIPVVLGLCTEKDDDGNTAEANHPRGNTQVKMQHSRRGN